MFMPTTSSTKPLLGRRSPVGIGAFAALIAALAPAAAHASFPSNWRLRPIQVIDAGEQAGAPRVRIEGFFAYTSTDPLSGPPVSGCGALDFFCRGNDGLVGDRYCGGGAARCLAQCRREWADIAAAAKAGGCVTLQANLWRSPQTALRALGSPLTDPDPYDAVMGVATVPCHPEAPSPARPDLPDICRVAAPTDAGSPRDGSDAATDVAADAATDAPPTPRDAFIDEHNDHPADGDAAADAAADAPAPASPAPRGGTTGSQAGAPGARSGGIGAGGAGGRAGSADSGGCSFAGPGDSGGAPAVGLGVALFLGITSWGRKRRCR